MEEGTIKREEGGKKRSKERSDSSGLVPMWRNQ
jgi:hypothetical protein